MSHNSFTKLTKPHDVFLRVRNPLQYCHTNKCTFFFLHGAKLRISCLFTVFNNENVCEKRSFFPISCELLLVAAKAKPIIHGKWSFLVQFFIKCWEGSQRESSNSKDIARSYRKILDNYEIIQVKLSINIVQKNFIKNLKVYLYFYNLKRKNPRNFALMLKSVVHKQIVHKNNVISFTFSRVFFKYAEQVLV